jgi:Radial spokehead-like protein
VNEAYRPWSIGKLLQLDHWQHHKPEILRQGRVVQFQAGLDGDDDDSSSEADGADNLCAPETPRALFASCSGDRLTNDVMSPWTIKLSDVAETLVSVRSQVWPGAFAFVKGR